MPDPKPPLWLETIARPRVSQLMRKLVTSHPPRPVLRFAIQKFSDIYGVEVDQAERNVLEYETFQAFFTRRLKPGLRPFSDDPEVVPSPSDGTLSAFGKLGSGTLVQAKGVEYSLDALLGSGDDANPYRGGSYSVVYLAPYNYHRVHTPVTGQLTHWRYVPGALYPVNKMGLKHVPGLFARNERIIGHYDCEFGKCAVIMVGATFVGHMTVAFTDLKTNESQPSPGTVTANPAVEMTRGDEFGVFEMGSTVVLLFDRDDLEPALPLGSSIVAGQAALRVHKG